MEGRARLFVYCAWQHFFPSDTVMLPMLLQNGDEKNRNKKIDSTESDINEQ
jgi:hypothetical protein